MDNRLTLIISKNATLYSPSTTNQSLRTGTQVHLVFIFLGGALLVTTDNATSLMTNPKLIMWSQVFCNDIAWNFEKFLVGLGGFQQFSLQHGAQHQSLAVLEVQLYLG